MLPRVNVILGFLACIPLFFFDFLLPWSTAGVIVVVGLFTLRRAATGRITRLDEAADSLYFLGFTITLLSLFVAFYRIGASDIDYQRADQAMIALFGVIGSGLSTTIAGILMRELVQMVGARDEVVDIGEVTSSDLKNVVDRLNAALSLGEEAVEVSRVASGSADRYRATFDSYSQTLDSYTESLRTFQDDVVTPMSGMKSEVGGALTAIVAQLKSTNAAFASTSGHVERAGLAVESIQQTLDRFSQTVPGLLDGVNNGAGDAARTLADLLTQQEQFIAAIRSELTELGKISAGLPAQGNWEALASLGDSLPGYYRGMRETGAVVERAGQRMETASQGFSDSQHVLQELVTALADAAAREPANPVAPAPVAPVVPVVPVAPVVPVVPSPVVTAKPRSAAPPPPPQPEPRRESRPARPSGVSAHRDPIQELDAADTDAVSRAKPAKDAVFKEPPRRRSLPVRVLKTAFGWLT